jgi:hypothetical protein
MHPRAPAALAAVLACLAPAASLAEEWPDPAERSGPRLPAPKEVTATAVARGAYVPASDATGEEAASTFGGSLSWCFAPVRRLGLYGRHELVSYRWANVTLLSFGHEVGLRLLAARHLTLEAAYLTHRVSRAWIDDFEASPGGVEDRGAELGAWLPFAPHESVRIDVHLIGRLFDVYRDTQGAFGGGARLSLLVADGHALVVELTAVRAQRSRPRAGVDETTWNLFAEASWRSLLTPRFGLLIGARLTTSMLVGEEPMLELKRSMIEEPMGVAYLGMFFGGSGSR